MALNFVIRKTASRFVPLFCSKTHHGCRHHNAATLFAAASNRVPGGSQILSQSPFLHRYATRASSDEKLLAVIDSEIKCAVESQQEDPAEELPAGFPFKIEDHPGQQTITLSREYQDEAISVEVHMPDLVTGENDDADGNDDEGEDKGNQSNIPLVVRVSKKTGPCLEFGCTAYPDEITIDSLSVKDPEISEDQLPYDGPDFSDLDENLQKVFHKYLEIRGIKPSTTNYLHAYMIDKDGREYITWLKNLASFMKA